MRVPSNAKTSDRMTIPTTDHYLLKHAHVPRPLLGHQAAQFPVAEGLAAFDNLVLVDLEIRGGAIATIQSSTQPSIRLSSAASSLPSAETSSRVPPVASPPLPTVDLRRGIVWSRFVDMHTHLDKGHIWGRSPNPDGTFATALHTILRDRERHWDSEDIYRRMEFGIKCSVAHGTGALRTHIDAYDNQANISFGAFKALQEEWQDRITLQAASLVSLDYFLGPQGEALADLVALVGGVLGGVAFPNPDLDAQLDRVFALAQERDLSLDFHVDESGDPADDALERVALTALRYNFTKQIVCGHCCSLALQPHDRAQRTIQRVKEAGIGIVSLPMCNLYLQDRNQVATGRQYRGATAADTTQQQDAALTHTPRWRGVTLLHELHHAGVPVAIASDNCRDPFYPFGDHDMLEVFREGVRIAHLDSPYADWSQVVTTTPALLMGLPQAGRIEVGCPADLVLFQARSFSELLARSQHDRTVLHRGRPIDTTLPDYAELDSLLVP